MTFSNFQKNGITEFFYILLIVAFRPSKIMHEKRIGCHQASFPTIRDVRSFLVNFVHVCRHSNELSVTKTNMV
jgi:hypothetical protein